MTQTWVRALWQCFATTSQAHVAVDLVATPQLGVMRHLGASLPLRRGAVSWCAVPVLPQMVEDV
jgi:hypothetical protein